MSDERKPNSYANVQCAPLTREAFEEGVRLMREAPMMRDQPRIIGPQAWERLQKHRVNPRFAKLHDSILVECAVANVDPALVMPKRERRR